MAQSEEHVRLSTGERIEILRRRKGLSVKALAGIAGTSAPHMSRIISGDRTLTTPIARALAVYLETSMDYLFRLSEDPRPFSSSARTSTHPFEYLSVSQQKWHELRTGSYLHGARVAEKVS